MPLSGGGCSVAKADLLFSKRIYVDQLYDLYSPLLTEKQREAWELHKFSDLSLAETAEKMGTSRQAVFDLISRSRDRLEELEGLLGFFKRESALKNDLAILQRENRPAGDSRNKN